MNDELNEVEEDEFDIVTSVETEDTDSPPEIEAESAPASEPEHEENQGSGVQKRINELTGRHYEDQDRIKALEAENNTLKAAPSQVEPAGKEPVAPLPSELTPPSPDLYYEDPAKYSQEMAAYQSNIAQSAINAHQTTTSEADRLRSQTDFNRQRQSEFVDKATALDIDVDEAYKSAELLQKRGINPNLDVALVAHDKAPALMDYLAKNPAVFSEINAIDNPVLAARKLIEIESEAIKKNVSSAPEPSLVLGGRGAKEPDDFDKACPGAVFIT